MRAPDIEYVTHIMIFYPCRFQLASIHNQASTGDLCTGRPPISKEKLKSNTSLIKEQEISGVEYSRGTKPNREKNLPLLYTILTGIADTTGMMRMVKTVVAMAWKLKFIFVPTRRRVVIVVLGEMGLS